MTRTALGVLVIAAVVTVLARRSSTPPERCRLAQTWYDGDVHFSQELELDAEGRGVWTTGGMDTDAPHQRTWFTWTRTGATFRAKFGPTTRTVGVHVSEHDGDCTLQFSGGFLGDDAQSVRYSTRR